MLFRILGFEVKVNFSTLPAAPPRHAFIPSILLHCLVIVLLGTVWVSSPTIRRLVGHATVVAPLPEAPDRPASPKLVKVTRRPALVLPRNPLPTPVLVLPIAPMAATPKLTPVALETPAVPAPAPAPPPKPTVRTDVFASITPAPVANPKPILPVEMGAFQVPVSNEKAVARKVMKTGVFDSGERQTGGTGAPTVNVAAAGFGDAQLSMAVGSPRGAIGSHGDAGFGAAAAAKAPAEMKPTVRAGGFDSSIAVPAALPKRQMEQVRPTEVEILFKPRPAYTEEARKLKIEGEVLVEVLFKASGEVRVLRVAKGLGHGLDEAAAQAAANIRFKPAERSGMAVDSAAVAHITFQLAY